MSARLATRVCARISQISRIPLLALRAHVCVSVSSCVLEGVLGEGGVPSHAPFVPRRVRLASSLPSAPSAPPHSPPRFVLPLRVQVRIAVDGMEVLGWSQLPLDARVWMYVPDGPHGQPPGVGLAMADFSYPLLQTCAALAY